MSEAAERSSSVEIMWWPVPGWPGIRVRVEGDKKTIIEGEQPVHWLSVGKMHHQTYCKVYGISGKNASVHKEHVTCPECIRIRNERYGSDEEEYEGVS